jgi:peptidoglycan/LPS O-acetylase OafA/YrhL
MKHRDGILDLVRGLSALLVMLGHLRAFIFLDFGEIKSENAVARIFYFTTGLGHQAVVVFFVLSGYFVGGSILSQLDKGSFTWRGYGAARLTRLWVVLLPALLFTLGIDLLGQQWNPEAYAGGLNERFMSGPTAAGPAAHDWVTFLGNLSFIQTVSVPVYGTNGPLWSLTNEFWYYVIFPLVTVGMVHLSNVRGRGVVVFQMLIVALLVGWLPRGLLVGGLIWILGAGVWWLVQRTVVKERGVAAKLVALCRGWHWRLAGGSLFFGTLAASKMNHWFGSDAAVGLAFAAWMLALTGKQRFSSWVDRSVTGLSEISYTLYIFHFPLLFFISAVVLEGKQFPADAQGFLWFSGLAVVTLATSAVMWWLFERNTTRVRKWILEIGR